MNYSEYVLFVFEFRTALHWASKRNHINVVEYLVEIGAFFDNLNNDGKSAVYYTKNEEIQKILLKGIYF